MGKIVDSKYNKWYRLIKEEGTPVEKGVKVSKNVTI